MRFSEHISPNYFRGKRTSLAKSRATFYVPSIVIKSFRHIIRRNYASSEKLDLTSTVGESLLILASLRPAWGEIYAFRISCFLFRVRDVQEKRVEEDRRRGAVISQVRAPAPCSFRSGPERFDRQGARYLYFVSVPERSSSRSTWIGRRDIHRPASGVACEGPLPPSSFAREAIDDQVVRRCRRSRQKEDYLQRRLEWWVKTGPSRQTYVARTPHGKRCLSRPMGKSDARHFFTFLHFLHF